MKNSDQPAFAQSFAADKDGNMYAANEKDPANGGLNKREYFAAMAMQGLLSNSFYAAEYAKAPIGAKPSEEAVALQAVIQADAILKQLES